MNQEKAETDIKTEVMITIEKEETIEMVVSEAEVIKTHDITKK